MLVFDRVIQSVVEDFSRSLLMQLRRENEFLRDPAFLLFPISGCLLHFSQALRNYSTPAWAQKR